MLKSFSVAKKPTGPANAHKMSADAFLGVVSEWKYSLNIHSVNRTEDIAQPIQMPSMTSQKSGRVKGRMIQLKIVIAMLSSMLRTP
jgi:hypothetical protein